MSSYELVMVMTVDEEVQEDYAVYDCSMCGKEINLDDEIHVWVERMGTSNLGTAHVHCSDACLQGALEAHQQKVSS